MQGFMNILGHSLLTFLKGQPSHEAVCLEVQAAFCPVTNLHIASHRLHLPPLTSFACILLSLDVMKERGGVW